MSIIEATIAGLAALLVWAIACPEFGHRLAAVCRALQAPAVLVLAVVTFYGGLWVVFALVPAGLQ